MGKLQTLSEIVREREAFPQPMTLRLMQGVPEVLHDVEARLAEMGFRRFGWLAGGGGAVALETTENQVVRISQEGYSERTDRVEHPAILKPIARQVFESEVHVKGHKRGKKLNTYTMIIEVMPKVRTEGVTEAHIKMLEDALENSGLYVQDIRKKGNVALLEVDGKEVPVLLDAGAAREGARKAEGDAHLAPWAGVQAKFEARETPSDVIDGAQARIVEKVMRGPKSFKDRALGWVGVTQDSRRESQTRLAITEDGLYGKQLAELYSRAAAKTDDTSNFSDALKAERALMQAELKR